MLMAIDNLYSKCNEGIVRIKYNYEEFAEETEPKNKKPKKTEEKGKAKKDPNEEKKADDEESPMETKCKLAIQKLKSILGYTRDYQAIIKECKERMGTNSLYKK